MLPSYERCCERATYWMAEALEADERSIEYQRVGLWNLAVIASHQVVMARTNYRYWISQAEGEL